MAGFGVQTNSDKVHSKTMQVPSYRLIVVRGTIEREREERKSLLAIVQARKRQLTVGKQQCWWWSDDQFMFCERKKRKNTEKVRDEWACFITIGCFYRNLKHQTKSSCAATEAFRLHLCFASVPTSKFNREKGNHGDKWLRCDFNIPFRNHQLLGKKDTKQRIHIASAREPRNTSCTLLLSLNRHSSARSQLLEIIKKKKKSRCNLKPNGH